MNLVDVILATAEICGTQLTEMGAQLLCDDLMFYPEHLLLPALTRCRKELKGRLTVSEVLSRLDDGRLTADEAWGILPWDEQETAVVTDEMMDAMGFARSAYEMGDKMGARLAFRERYNQLVLQARSEGKLPRWYPTLGWDSSRREGPIQEAIQRGRIQASDVPELLEAVEFRKQITPLKMPEHIGQIAAKANMKQIAPPRPEDRMGSNARMELDATKRMEMEVEAEKIASMENKQRPPKGYRFNTITGLLEREP